jgi:curved DNA-binding protein CbpA
MAEGPLAIKLRCASWQQLATIYKRDLSQGTMFLRAGAPPPIGTSIRIDLSLPSASVVVLTGVVQSHVNDPQRGAGVELKLAPIAPETAWMMESALASERRRLATPARGTPTLGPHHISRQIPVIPAISDSAEVTAAEHELIRALVSEAESLKKLNPFLVLGVGYEAGDPEVRAAFGELTKRYHPDRFARYESTELRQLAAEIFILIRDAYRRLGDPAGRGQVLQALGKAAPAPRAVPDPARTGPPVAPPRSVHRVAAPPAPPVRPGELRPAAPRRATGDAVPGSELPGSRGRAATEPSPASGAADYHLAAPGAHLAVLDTAALEDLIDQGRLDDAHAGFKRMAKKHATDRNLRAGVELCEGLIALAARDRLAAAQHFEAALEIDPSNERAARELADMRRQATNERKGLLSRLMGKQEG